MRAALASCKPSGRLLAATAGAGTALWWANRTPLPSEASSETARRKTVLVTGGTNGLGYATVKRLAERGDVVFTCGRDPARVSVVNQLPNVRAFVCDLKQESAVRQLVDRVSAELQGRPLDALINNAGVQRHGDPILEERSLAVLDEAWSANFRAPVMLVQRLWPLLEKADAPIILNVGSTCSHPKFAGAFFLGYPVTKSALSAFSNALRQEVALVHKTARVVHFTTGAFETNLTSDAPGKAASNLRSYGGSFASFADALQKKQKEAFAMLSPHDPEEFAAAVAAVVHPAAGESSLLREYALNVSLLERVVPWLPQVALDGGFALQE